MELIWQYVVEWLHSLGLQFGDRAGMDVAPVVSEAVGKMDMPSLLALAAALGWVSGFRLYAVVFLVGSAGAMGWITLPTGLAVLQHPALLTASGMPFWTLTARA